MPNIVVKHKLFYSYKLIYPEATATARALKRQQHLDHQLICLFVRVNAEIIQDIILGRPLASFILAVFWWLVRPSVLSAISSAVEQPSLSLSLCCLRPTAPIKVTIPAALQPLTFIRNRLLGIFYMGGLNCHSQVASSGRSD